MMTSSSAVAKRLRDASCLSVVSFNSTKRQVESFIVSYVGYRFITACSQMCCSVVFGVTLRHLVINILSSSPAINTAAYYQRCVIIARWSVGGRGPPATLLTTPCLLQRKQQALKPDIGSESQFLPTPPAFDAPVRGGPRQNIAMLFGIEKLE